MEQNKILTAAVQKPHEDVGCEPIDYDSIDSMNDGPYFDGCIVIKCGESGDINDDVSFYNDFNEKMFPDHQRTIHKAKEIHLNGTKWSPKPPETDGFYKLSDKQKNKYVKKHNNIIRRHNARKKYNEFLYSFLKECALKDDYKAYLKELPFVRRWKLLISRKLWINSIPLVKMQESNLIYSSRPIKIKMNFWRYIHKFITKRTNVTVDDYALLLRMTPSEREQEDF